MSAHSSFLSGLLSPMISRHAFFLGACALVCGSAAPASAQSLFDLLFGGARREPVVAPAPQDDQAERDANRRAHGEAEAKKRAERAAAFAKGGGVGGKMNALAPEAGVKSGSLAHFSADPTLRAGDVVVTAQGFMVYRGGHSEKSFAPIGAGRTALATLEKASRQAATQQWTARSPLAVAKDSAQTTQVVKSVQVEATPEATGKASLN